MLWFHRSDEKLGKRDASMTFENYGVIVNKGFEAGNQYIKDNIEISVFEHKILVGWCLLLSQKFVLAYADISRRLVEQSPTDFKHTMMSELLERIGINADCQPLFDTCAKFNLENDNEGEWLFQVVDQQVTLDCKEVWTYRPLQLDVVKNDIIGKTTISSTGKGWDKSHINWFDKTIEPEKMKNKPPPNYARKFVNLHEAQESIYINKTLSTVRLEFDNDIGRVYVMCCDVADLIAKDGSLLNGPHKAFFENPQFECSHQMIRSLPFSFVEKLKLKENTPLPGKYLKSLRSDAARAEKNHIRSIQLWRHRGYLIPGKNWKVGKRLVYRAEVEDGAVTQKRSIKTVFLDEAAATFALKQEPWIIDTAHHLCTVRNYKKITFGDGAKLKTDQEDRKPPGKILKIETESSYVRINFWSDKSNNGKLCVEGAVANLLYHMNMHYEANLFKKLCLMTDEELCHVMGVLAMPNKVQSKRSGIDPMDKCMWILEKKFNCRRTMYLKPEEFATSQMLNNNLFKLRFPVILSILGERSSYNHVVVVWKQMVIDFENEKTSALTIETIENIAGINNRFHKFVRGYGILPSKAMKRAVNDWTDWGEKDMHGDLRYLFKKGK
jgi:hypothetical protein